MDHVSQPASLGRAIRNRVVWNAKVLTSCGETNVRVRDLSSTGARVLCEVHLTATQDIVFKRGKLFAAGHVVWFRDGEAGLEFYRPVELPLAIE